MIDVSLGKPVDASQIYRIVTITVTTAVTARCIIFLYVGDLGKTGFWLLKEMRGQ